MISQGNKYTVIVFSSESWKEEKCDNRRTLECFCEGRALESTSAGPSNEFLAQDLDVMAA